MQSNSRQSQLLDLHIRSGTLSHAYLFTGPRHAGKMTMALRLTSSLLCAQHPSGILNSCGMCISCRGIAAGTHPDVTIEDTHKNDTEQQRISIDIIRRIRGQAVRSAYSSKRVFIIRDAGHFTREAANAFLKILEEPAADTMFLLLAESLEEVLPTIRSRAWIMRFWPILTTHTPLPQTGETISLLSAPFTDRLQYANTFRDNPEHMEAWYHETIVQMSRVLHNSLLSDTKSPVHASVPFLARTIKHLMEGEARFLKPYGTKRILFESDILGI